MRGPSHPSCVDIIGQVQAAKLAGGANFTNDYNVGKTAPTTLRLMCPPHGSLRM